MSKFMVWKIRSSFSKANENKNVETAENTENKNKFLIYKKISWFKLTKRRKNKCY